MWTPRHSPYWVDGDVFVASLTINPGVQVLFRGDYLFSIAGILEAEGTQHAPIIFDAALGTDQWQGIHFDNSHPGSALRHCIIRESANSGLRIVNSEPLIESCTIERNYAQSGGGVYILLDSETPMTVTLRSCTIRDNSSTFSGNNCAGGGHGNGGGGGVWAKLETGKLLLEKCEISGNVSGVQGRRGTRSGSGVYVNGEAEIRGCVIRDNSCYSYHCPCSPGAVTVWSRGGGIYARGMVTLETCSIRDNLTHARACFTGTGIASGSGVFFASGVLSMSNCVVADNTASGNGGGNTVARRSAVYIGDAEGRITNSTVAHNTNSGLYGPGEGVQIVNSILYFNGEQQITGDPTITYSNIQDMFLGLGNHDVSPVFASPTDLRVLPPSLCIDAGDPDAGYNDACFPPSWGTERNDQGAHGGPLGCGWSVHPRRDSPDRPGVAVRPGPTQAISFGSHPNPFRESLQIQFVLSESSPISVRVFDAAGRAVSSLLRAKELSPGTHFAVWDGRDQAGSQVAAGVYFVRLESEEKAVTGRVVLLR